MAKKKDKPQVINNIQELNLEIDYDKLAEAIVKAQKQTNVETDIKDQKNKHEFLKNIYCFIFNKAEQKNNILVDFFKLPIVGLFRLISIACCVLFPFIIINLKIQFLNVIDNLWFTFIFISHFDSPLSNKQ